MKIDHTSHPCLAHALRAAYIPDDEDDSSPSEWYNKRAEEYELALHRWCIEVTERGEFDGNQNLALSKFCELDVDPSWSEELKSAHAFVTGPDAY